MQTVRENIANVQQNVNISFKDKTVKVMQFNADFYSVYY